jgi:hypothetical protein
MRLRHDCFIGFYKQYEVVPGNTAIINIAGNAPI